MIQIRRGLNLPIAGKPEQSIVPGPPVRSVAVIGSDYHDMKPTMAVQVGDKVKLGQPLFSDKKNPGVVYTAPAAGTVTAIHRGARRVLQSVVIDIESDIDGDEQEIFASYSAAELAGLARDKVKENLINAGQWTALRTRPYSKIPAPESEPHAIFVTAMDTQPLAGDPQVVIAGAIEDFNNGLTVLSRLTDGKVYVCTAADASLAIEARDNIAVETFAGPHPAGNVGTHIHYLDPVSSHKTVWTIGYQDVIAFGKLFTTGRIAVDRVVALAGPQVEKPQLLRTRLGANLEELTAGLLVPGENRIISGSVFGGRQSAGPFAFLGRYDNQVSVLLEGRERPFLHYLKLGGNRFSAMPIYLSNLLKNKRFSFTTSTNGSERAMVPVGSYERVMPLDILPTQLLRALIVGDTETAQQLGCLELDEEDLALCTFVCPGKYEYGPILRENLSKIEREG
jgi:Na+-transporting NADH:ubiquinone oxidoreductase subunit A